MRDDIFTVDTIQNAFDMDSSDSRDSVDFDWDSMSVVSVENAPWQAAFDTDEFIKLSAVVARPIEQRYVRDGKQVTFKKTREALKESAAWIDNVPLTLGHPQTKTVKSINDIHGFWREPNYDEDVDELRANLYVPVNDEEAKSFLTSHNDVSVGFYNKLSEAEESNVDAYQTNIFFDHVAAVKTGRCSEEDGCGLHMPTADAIEIDTARMFELQSQHVFEEGDWVEWDTSDDTTYGKVDAIKEDGCYNESIKGSNEICANSDEAVVRVEVFNPETDESRDEYVAHMMSELREWGGPTSDYCSPSNGCSCGCHIDAEHLSEVDLVPPEGAQDAAQKAIDFAEEYYPDDYRTNDSYPMTDTGWDRAEQLASGDELSVADISDGTAGMSNWWARHKSDTVTDDGEKLKLENPEEPWTDNSYIAGLGWGGIVGMNWAMRKDKEITNIRETMDSEHNMKTVHGVTFIEGETRDGQLDESEIPNDDYESHYLIDGETKTASSYPVVDAEGYLRKGNVDAAWQLRGHANGMSKSELEEALTELNREFENPPIETNGSTMTDNDGNEEAPSLDDIGVDIAEFDVDTLAEQHEGVEDLRNDNEELQSDLEDARDEASEYEERLEAVKTQKEELSEELDSFKQSEKEDVIDDITTLTDTWDEEELYEADIDTLEGRLDALQDAASTEKMVNPSNDGNTGGNTSGPRRKLDLSENAK